MADETEGDAFEKGVLAALDDKADGAAEEPKAEADGEDPVAKLAAEMVKAGATPDKAQEYLRDLQLLQTPEGQRAYWDRFIGSPAGAQMREAFGREHLSTILAEQDGGEKLMRLATEFGFKPQPTHAQEQEEEATPESRKIRDLEAQNAAILAKLSAIEGKTTATSKALQDRSTAEERQEAFVDWASNKGKVPPQVLKATLGRARELATLYPDQYGSAAGFKRAAEKAFSDGQAFASLAPPQRPKSLRGSGSGAVPKEQDVSKLSLDERIKLAANDYAEAMSAEE